MADAQSSRERFRHCVPLLLAALGVELDGDAVDAVAHPRRRVALAFENVALMGAALCADNLSSDHPVRDVLVLRQRALADGLVESGPAAVGLELGTAVEEEVATHHALVRPFPELVVQRRGVRPLRALPLRDIEREGANTGLEFVCKPNRKETKSDR